MIMPSLLTWTIGAATVVVLSVALRYLANDANALARSLRRRSIAIGSTRKFRKAA
jgi:hypothetical protein